MRAPHSDKTPCKKGTWTPEEDEMLVAYIRRYGIWNWSEMPRAAGLLRTGKSCRLRWMNYLRPDIKRGNFTKEEDEIIIKLHEKLGNKWATIATRLSRRTDNEIKNYWHSHLKKRINAAKNATGFQSTSSVENKQQDSTTQEVSLPTSLLPTNQEVLNGDQLTAKFTTSSNLFGEVDKTRFAEENFSFSESSGEPQCLWEQSFSMEGLYFMENNVAMYTGDQYLWYEESCTYPSASLEDSSTDFWADPFTYPRMEWI